MPASCFIPHFKKTKSFKTNSEFPCLLHWCGIMPTVDVFVSSCNWERLFLCKLDTHSVSCCLSNDSFLLSDAVEIRLLKLLNVAFWKMLSVGQNVCSSQRYFLNILSEHNDSKNKSKSCTSLGFLLLKRNCTLPSSSGQHKT